MALKLVLGVDIQNITLGIGDTVVLATFDISPNALERLSKATEIDLVVWDGKDQPFSAQYTKTS